ncbi:oligoendopeptidase, pepF/M3 family [Clostridium amylolyticum]|uniref:Oligoendopeptidase, pepF/M3 family n=2 Tax=Clostridium amylolyticum TaxID=1121298 RepID=A0A1M6NQM2_9CLOT|nr:oligoendopeptidase, pepF/M3 family [Clostridium amylolyticum]
MENNNSSMQWSLKELYSSFNGEDFQKDLELLDYKIDYFINWSNVNLNGYENIVNKIEEYINLMKEYKGISGRLSSFASLRVSADANCSDAKKYIDIIEKKNTRITAVQVKFSKWLIGIKDLQESINSSKLLKEHEFYLQEIITNNNHILSEKEEMIISKMKLTGSSAWANLKNSLASNLLVDIDIDGKTQEIGINNIKNMYFSNNSDLRKKAFYAERKSNEKIAEGVAAALNGIKGEVLTLCEIKGYNSPLNKTLEDSRMDEETLNTMLKVMKENLGEFKPYYLKKAQLLGHKDKLPFYDIMAPVGKLDKEYTFEEARDFIVKHYSSFSKDMGDLALRAFNSRWIDAEVREGKRSGAFCSNLHSIGESRVLCSFSGSFKNVCTIAHELGHAYHGSILQKESVLNSSYPMPLAETASIFAENIVRNAALEEADKEESLVILGAELINCSSVIVDIYSRFLFEKELFERRRESQLPLKEIKELMVWAQKEAYGDAILEETFDAFGWIHKPHYYYAERNFYNFPYAFGLLFAKGLYSIYLKEGNDFINKYNEVLRLTGQANIYDVAKYAGIDIHDEEFWQGSMDMIKKDIEKFCNIDI